jgi:hypothetical protein
MNGAVPFRLRHDAGAPQVEWVRTHGMRFTEPFFEDTVRQIAHRHPSSRASRRARTPLDALEYIPAGPAPTALIFHVSRCGSTLVSRMLAALPHHLVASEPPIIDDILRTVRRDPAVTDERRIAWLHGAVHALGRSGGGADRFFVKLDCWHLFELPLLRRAFPGVPFVFLYRHPLPVIVSLLRQPSLALVRGTLSADELGLPDRDRDLLGREEHAAAILGALFRAAAEFRDAFIPVAYEQLPAFVWESMPGAVFCADDRARLQAAAAFDAKNPAQRFVADSAAKLAAASPAARAASARWAEPHYERWLRGLGSRPLETAV